MGLLTLLLGNFPPDTSRIIFSHGGEAISYIFQNSLPFYSHVSPLEFSNGNKSYEVKTEKKNKLISGDYYRQYLGCI